MAGPRILVTGASGLLGTALVPELRGAGELKAPGLEELDLDRPDTVRRVMDSFRPTLVIHLAADTRVDRCEEHPEDAFRVNARGAAHVATACRRLGARMVLVSTDYVFDGRQRVPYREQQATAPLSVYGRSKDEAERAVLSMVPDRLVVRSASLFGEGGRSFVAAVLEKAQKGEPLEVVEDQIQSPTWVGHLAPALARAAVSDQQGILHVTASGHCSWFEFAVAILDRAGFSVPCRPTSSEKLARPAKRPAYSVLDGALAAESLGLKLPDWRDGLAAYLEEGGL